MTRRRRLTLIILIAGVAVVVMASLAAKRFDLPFTGIEEEWAIGIGVGTSPPAPAGG